MKEVVLVLDCGGSQKEIIAQTVRELSVYSEIKPGHLPVEEVRRLSPIGIILTGDPNRVDLDSSLCDPELFTLGIPILRFPLKTGDSDGNDEKSDNIENNTHDPLNGGREFLNHFLFDVCGAAGDYKLEDFIDDQVQRIRQQVGKEKVLLALSGGVDSSVCAGLLSKAVPGQLTCLFVDHGFMRLHEGDEIERVLAKRELRFIRVNAQDRFLTKVQGVTDPETKRKLIGEEFIRVFEEEAAKLGYIPFLAQGTIYPDIVESGGEHGKVIKSHHNVGGLPETLAFAQLVEPLSELFKDEVRRIGKILGLPDSLVSRQPFPGPGLAVRVMGDITKDKLQVLRQADAILRKELDEMGEGRPNQYFAILTNTLSVGIKENNRTYDPVIAIRAVMTRDFMTCEYAPLSHEVLGRISSRITSEIPSVSRVVYDITSKPPATVEWE